MEFGNRTLFCRIFTPARAAFAGSLLLSFIAVQGHLINRDGVFYLTRAQVTLEQGLAAVLKLGDWNFLAILIAACSALTGLNPETAAQLMNAFFMAGACALAVVWVQRRSPEAAWAACLVVLAMPAFNQYRHEILREFGFWFFSLLGLWLAARWGETQRRRDALLGQLALAVAVLFRLEAAVFYPALMLWQAFAAPAGQKARRALMIGALPLAGGLLVLLVFVSGVVTPPGRLVYYLDAANPLRTIGILGEAGRRMSDLVFPYTFSQEEAGYVLFFGLLSIIPVKFMMMTGLLLVPLVWQLGQRPARDWLTRWQPLPWALLAYLLTLVAFVTHQFFLAGRYVSMLHWLTVPFVAGGLTLMLRRWPRWRIPVIVLALAMMAANVVSSTPPRTHIVEAGRWLAEHAPDRRRVGADDNRIAYHAGLQGGGIAVMGRPELAQALAEGRLDMIAIRAPRGDQQAEVWLRENHLGELRRFDGRGGESIIVAAPERAMPSGAGR
ncbi:MAG: hypothetical protein LBE33_00880 [Zoogloeaceae bacterium]|jgi:hypothetical protein|nr:hypothetical protein [Zoogloeaceae bacterium]